jgi:hypothetical protein
MKNKKTENQQVKETLLNEKEEDVTRRKDILQLTGRICFFTGIKGQRNVMEHVWSGNCLNNSEKWLNWMEKKKEMRGGKKCRNNE